MQTRFWLLCGSWILAASINLHSQDGSLNPNYPPPSPPLIAPVPDKAQWTITVTYDQQPAPAPAPKPGKAAIDRRIKEVTSTKVGPIKHDSILYMDGTAGENWYVGKRLLMPDSFNFGIMTFNPEEINRQQYNGGIGTPFYAEGYPGLAWIQLKYYDKAAIFNGQPCYHYYLDYVAPPTSDDSQEKPSSPEVKAEAWIGIKTGLPVGYRIGEASYLYQFGPEPVSPLELPPRYLEAWKNDQKQMGIK